ncbi:hypothetical protein Q1695_002972 [Nippostrongylus brasiliensis]|nr:hypothetical protein Q1695_002972 [Nippostrongylus brasiliensis]
MPERLKSKIYRTVVRWVAFYGAESWLTTRGIEYRLIVMEMKMVRWMDCVTRLDHMAYGDIRKRFGIVLIGEKPHETCLRWYGHVLRASSDTMCKIGLTLEVRRGRGRPKQHWLDRMPADLKTMGVHPEQEYGLFRGLGTRMRTFVSRPIKEQTMMQFLRRVEQREIEADREELRLRELNRGAVPFPLDRVSRSLRRRNGINEVFADESFLECSTQLPTTSFAEEMAAFDRGGNQNEGAVVVNGSPFWVDPLSKLPTAPDTSDTEDDLPLNGGVIFEVHQGTIELVPMPEIP